MKAGDLVIVKPRYSEWGYGIGVYLGSVENQHLCKVLFDNNILIFHRHELERYEDR